MSASSTSTSKDGGLIILSSSAEKIETESPSAGMMRSSGRPSLSGRFETFLLCTALVDSKHFSSPHNGVCEECRMYLVDSAQYSTDQADELECMLQLGVPNSGTLV
eukprot:GHVS01092944.1.p2 GENE.GHVS01092944.1~~GHVS01092944.1.p2  ORF type:complete len:106 (-),score=10.05 GHVS01092944.1:218-535(-)